MPLGTISRGVQDMAELREEVEGVDEVEEVEGVDKVEEVEEVEGVDKVEGVEEVEVDCFDSRVATRSSSRLLAMVRFRTKAVKVAMSVVVASLRGVGLSVET